MYSFLLKALAERKLLRMMCGVTLKDRISTSDVAERVGADLMKERLRRQPLAIEVAGK